MDAWTESAWQRGLRIGAATLLAILVHLLTASAAGASTDDIIAPSDPKAPTVGSGWQAGTCSAEPPDPGAEICSVATPSQFFERAAAHPHYGFTQFIVRNAPYVVGPVELGPEQPVGELKTIRVDLPVGLSVNPGATPRCDPAVFATSAAGCPPDSQVGESEVTTSLLGTPTPPAAPLTKVPVYNIEPPIGQPARFGLELAGNEVFLQADVADGGDFHEGFTIAVPPLPSLEPLIKGLILKNRLVFDGRAGDGTFITTPSTCRGPAVAPHEHDYSTYLLASSITEEASAGYQFPQSAGPPLESPIPPGTSPKECDTIPYAPTIAVAPGAAETDSPAAVSVDLEVPHILGADAQDSSNTRNAVVALSRGMGINPSAANGLRTCSDDQFGKLKDTPIACPPASKIGTVEVSSPPLPEQNLTGNVYVGEQKSRVPTSGEQYRILVDAQSPRYGIELRLEGKVSADPQTGQLTTTFTENPQVPFTSIALDFDGGARAVLSSPPTCGPNKTATALTPWSGNPPATPAQEFSLSKAPGGSACAKTMAERPFGPSFAAGPKSAKAGAYSPVSIRIARNDGQQELKGVDVTLAPGMTGKLAGIPYCSATALAAAAGRAGSAEAANSSCAAKSQVGVASISAGTGPSPLAIKGKVFLSGPYRGAPLSLAVVTPATAGPFDLGTVVVRVALSLDPETAQIRALSDPVPDVFGGAKLDIRAVDIAIDRKDFTLNPTSCGPLTIGGTLNGGGADPTNPAAFSAFPVSVPFQTTNCGDLPFKPRLFTRLFGSRKKATKRAQHPKFRAVLIAREGDANIGRAAVTLPHSQFLDQSHIRTVCTRVQLAAGKCPEGAIYGHARAKSPLLDEDLAGPVYLVSSDNMLPDLLVDLHGQVDVRLRGVISSKKGRIKNVFYPVPDVPVSRFVLEMKGGKKGLLVNSRDLCAKRSFSFMNLKAQNGKQLRKKRLRLRVPACRGANGKGRTK
jgi:hypothetical protein